MVKSVSLVKGNNRKENIKRALELIKKDLDGIKDKSNILIKPNLTATKNIYANTSVEAVEAVLEFLFENFMDFDKKRITIVEGSGSAHYEKSSTKKVLEDFGYFNLLKKYRNLAIETVDDYKKFFELEVKTVKSREKIKIAERIKDFDYKISVAIPKTHDYAIATFGIKNMLGFIKQEDKTLVHGMRTPSEPQAVKILGILPASMIPWLRRKSRWLANFLLSKNRWYTDAVKVINHNVADVCKTMIPDLVVLDGFYCMEEDGPVAGKGVFLGCAIASADALKADGIGARVIGLEPSEIGYLHYLSKMGLGDYSLNGLVGDKIEEARKRIKMHPTYDVQKRWI